ncbi:hypothetical protein AOR02nite_14980 [Acetobacter orientalis]|uniref:Uncharacterized protein n=1 Tax=Acetobacter orientalis TaxID=146474 RepID=A0A0D6NG82_9PROT|nr:hypothetical protein Abor_003_094 [Acetobacter orientalis]GEL61656.1 hypothetical protein AOR02nite_14980 [Acetobacter orientalis]
MGDILKRQTIFQPCFSVIRSNIKKNLCLLRKDCIGLRKIDRLSQNAIKAPTRVVVEAIKKPFCNPNIMPDVTAPTEAGNTPHTAISI